MKKIFTLLCSVLVSMAAYAAGHIVTVNNSNVSCFGGNDAFATAMVSGGSGSFSYSWTPFGGTTQTVNGLPAGSYTVTVTDNSDMSTATANFTVNQPAPLSVFTSTNPASCNGTCDGQASAMVTGGTAPYTYSWTPSGPMTPVYLGLCPGTYTVVVTDINGCTGFATATVITGAGGSLPGVTVTDSIYNETCLASGDGAIDINLSGSNPGPFTYQWNNGQTTQDAIGLESNLYTVIIYDSAMNCMSLSYQVQAIGINCGGVSGTVFADENNDCLNNSGDYPLSNIMLVANPGGYQAFTNSTGNYFFNNLPYGSYAITQQISNPYISPNSICNSTINATINGSNPYLTNQNFADTLEATGGADVVVTTYISALRPGFPGSIGVYLYNYTGIPANGVVKAGLPNGYGSLIIGGTPGYTITGDTISWNYSGLGYGSLSFNADIVVPAIVPIGTVYTVCAIATVVGGDVAPLNNLNCTSRTVIGSYDPNDKSVSPEGYGAEGNITLADEELTYLIRFQNTGTAEAINIHVDDTLSANLDLSSLQVIATSHPYDLEIHDNNLLRWRFDNIMLADSNTNEPASHGWILYKVKQSASNTIGDVIENTAYIYFDFNSAVITNTTINTVAEPLGVKETESTNNVAVFPNPFSDNTTFVINSSDLNGSYSFELSDVLGKTVKQLRTNEKQFSVSRNGLENGIYFYTISNSEGFIGKGKVIIK
jgi:uncharacterized repeat protein (TIGR01451 family)